MEVLPTMVPGKEDPEVDPLEVIEMSLPLGTAGMLRRQGLTYQDVLEGKVPGLDPEKILDEAEHEADPPE